MTTVLSPAAGFASHVGKDSPTSWIMRRAGPSAMWPGFACVAAGHEASNERYGSKTSALGLGVAHERQAISIVFPSTCSLQSSFAPAGGRKSSSHAALAAWVAPGALPSVGADGVGADGVGADGAQPTRMSARTDPATSVMGRASHEGRRFATLWRRTHLDDPERHEPGIGACVRGPLSRGGHLEVSWSFVGRSCVRCGALPSGSPTS